MEMDHLNMAKAAPLNRSNPYTWSNRRAILLAN